MATADELKLRRLLRKAGDVIQYDALLGLRRGVEMSKSAWETNDLEARIKRVAKVMAEIDEVIRDTDPFRDFDEAVRHG
jgi:hypothetical protein